MTAKRGTIRAYMLDEIADHVDWETGEVNSTALAEDAANHFEHPEWLGDETHEVWDIAVEVAEEAEGSHVR